MVQSRERERADTKKGVLEVSLFRWFFDPYAAKQLSTRSNKNKTRHHTNEQNPNVQSVLCPVALSCLSYCRQKKNKKTKT